MEQKIIITVHTESVLDSDIKEIIKQILLEGVKYA